MPRQFFLDLAARHLRMPVGPDLVLREHADAEAILLDGPRLGQVLVEAARRYRMPMAIHLMDLAVEKAAMLHCLGIPLEHAETYQFTAPIPDDVPERLRQALPTCLTPRMQANLEAIEYIRQTAPDILPVGMCIGPFSLMTKLLADPITPVYLAGTGASAEDEPEVGAVETLLEMAMAVIEHNIARQIDAGVTAMVIAEPAANVAYFSPSQLGAGADTYERYAMKLNRRLAQSLESRGIDLVFHCCGVITDSMLQAFAALNPAMLSLGSSRRLWDDARMVAPATVLYGNLPTKKFYSDTEMPLATVRALTRELHEQMAATGHPFILGSECDVLSVPGSHETIREKVQAMLEA